MHEPGGLTLYENHPLARAILQTIRESLLVLRPDLTVQSANHAFYRTFRTRPEDTVGRSFTAIGDGLWDIPDLEQRLKDVLRGGEPFDDYEVEREFPAIGLRIMLLSATKIEGSGELTDLALLAIEDRTAGRTAERLTEAAAIELERSNRELQEFASVASHDLQEPLRKILAFGERLQTSCGEALDDRGRDYLARMRESAERMQALISDLLSYSRLGANERPFLPVDLGSVAREVLRALEVEVEKSGGIVEVDPLPTVEADRTQMGQLLQNLVSNALKFRRPGVPPVVKIRARVVSEGSSKGEHGPRQVCVLTVEDNGIGFDPKYASRIFQVFERLHGKKAYEGNGIGLAIGRKIVERHRGSITATSTPGEGAVFTVILPFRHQNSRPTLNSKRGG